MTDVPLFFWDGVERHAGIKVTEHLVNHKRPSSAIEKLTWDPLGKSNNCWITEEMYMHQLTQDPEEGPDAFWLSTWKHSSIPKGKHFSEQ